MRLICLLFIPVAFAAGSELPEDHWCSQLLPRPQRIDRADGEFPLDTVARGIRIAAPTAEAGGRLRERLAEVLAGIWPDNPPPLALETDASFGLKAGDVADASPGELAAEHRQEGYALTLVPTGLSAEAPTESGLFYAMMTLEQLLRTAVVRGETSIPCMHIVDWPALAMRGPHEDYGRNQLPTMDDHKRSIRIAAQYKANTYFWFIEPDHFVYEFDPEISTEYDRFTFDEIRELVAYAKNYYIEVIPVVELLAHMEMTLRHERYRHLSEDGKGGGTLCPTSDESFEFARRIIDEVAPAFGARYFHCGLDESQAVGQGRSATAVQERGLEQVYADYYTRMNDAVKAHGQTMIMYADIVLHHPGILDLLPDDIVLMFWDYRLREHYDGLDRLKKSGCPVLALSGMWDWNNLYPLYATGCRNMQALAAQARDVGAIGHSVSSWGDGFRHVAGVNLSELNHFGFTYCNAVSWNPALLSLEAFSPAFAASFFASNDPALADALTRLARCQGENLKATGRARRMFHTEPLEAVLSMMGVSEDGLAFWRNLKSETAAVHVVLTKVKPQQNADVLSAIDLAARLLECSADMALAYSDLAHAMSQPAFDRESSAAVIEELAARHRALWDEYEAVWRATNRPLNLVHIGRLWNSVSDEMVALAQDVRSSAFPPASEKKTLAAFEFDEAGESAWLESLGSGITLAAAQGEPTIAEEGPSEEGGHLHLDHGAHLEAVDTDRILDIKTAPLLVEAWVRHRGQREQQYGASIFSYGIGGGFRLGINHKGETLFTLYGIGEATGTQSIVPPDGAWHHVAVNFHHCRNVDVYVDGVLTDQLELRGYPRSPSNPLVRVGNEIGLVTPFEGDIDRIRVSTGVFAAEELDAIDDRSPRGEP